MKIIEIVKKNHVSEIILIIFFLFLSFICLNFKRKIYRLFKNIRFDTAFKNRSGN